MLYRVAFAPEALAQLTSLYDYIAEAASPATAARYTEAIVAYCEAMEHFPARGHRRDDVRPGMRVTHYKKRTVIAFAVDDQALLVSIIGVYYGGQDYETLLQDDDNDDVAD